MGCDIHAYAEGRYRDGSYFYQHFQPFYWRNYAVFAFLAGVRNYSNVKPLSEPRGLPADTDFDVKDQYSEGDDHTPSWVLVKELLEFNYDSNIEYLEDDERPPWQIKRDLESSTTWREFLGSEYFDNLKALEALKIERVVFWFDN